MLYTIELQVQAYTLALDVVRAQIATPQQVLGSLGESLLTANQDRHEQNLNPDGSQWKPTKNKKRRILYQHGDMLGSFSYQIHGDELVLGFSDQKAKWHHKGTDPYTISPFKARALAFNGMYRKRVQHPGLPARKLIGFPDADRQLVVDVLEDHLTSVLKQVR